MLDYKPRVKILSVSSLLVLLASGGVQAQSSLQIDWGTSTVLDTITDSAGGAIHPSNYAIELGGFAGGFTPTTSNMEQWLANWQVFDAVTDPDSDKADAFLFNAGTTDARYVGSDFLAVDQTSLSEDGNGVDIFDAGSQAYVFVRNSDITGPDSEWLLYTSQEGEDWQFPSVQGSQLQFPLTWFVSDADEVIYGGAHGEPGPGEFTDPSTDFVLRTHTFTSSVPEPSTSLLLLMASLGLTNRRRCRT